MVKRKVFRPTAWESLEDRVVLNGHHAAPGLGLVGAMGDSYTDEYQFYPRDQTHARGWVEILAYTRKADFGPIASASRGEPRNAGYATDWARWGSTSSALVANQLPGLTRQVAGGKIHDAFIFTGGNDFLYFLQSAAANPPTPAAAGASIAAIEANAAANIDIAVTTLLAANPNVKVVLGTVPSLSLIPIVAQAEAAAPGAQALVGAVDQAIAQYDAHLAGIAATNPRVALADIAGASSQLASSGPSASFGGATINLTTPGDDYHSFILADGLHVGTIGQGLIANLFLQAVDAKFGAQVPLFTPARIVNLARLVQHRTRNLR